MLCWEYRVITKEAAKHKSRKETPNSVNVGRKVIKIIPREIWEIPQGKGGREASVASSMIWDLVCAATVQQTPLRSSFVSAAATTHPNAAPNTKPPASPCRPKWILKRAPVKAKENTNPLKPRAAPHQPSHTDRGSCLLHSSFLWADIYF